MNENGITHYLKKEDGVLYIFFIIDRLDLL